VEFIAVDDTTCTETEPGPSLTNEKVRGAEGLSTDGSSTKSLNVIAADGEVWGIAVATGSCVEVVGVAADGDSVTAAEVPTVDGAALSVAGAVA
jgi:hypothetical protein